MLAARQIAVQPARVLDVGVNKPHELPPSAEEFIGRAVELGQLITRLRERKNTAVVGAAGLGKTALSAKALREVVGEAANPAPGNPFPDGIVYLDLYTLRGSAEAAWDALANRLGGLDFMERTAAKVRAEAACRGKCILVVIEGGEEADGENGRAHIHEIFGVLSAENRWLLLTRLKTQAAVAESVEIERRYIRRMRRGCSMRLRAGR